MAPNNCPVCLSIDGYKCLSRKNGLRDATDFECEVCGKFAISGSAIDDGALRGTGWTKVRRAALSHSLRITQKVDEIRFLASYDLDGFQSAEARLPSPASQALAIIRYIGDRVSETGTSLNVLGPDFTASVGSPDRVFAVSILREIQESGSVSGTLLIDLENVAHVSELNLTLRGWQEYKEEKAGKIRGNYGFLALKFNDPILDPLILDHVKPAIKLLGYDAFDLRDVAEAGIIDNLMRIRIRESAFVIADLTHENAGAYWEAGYAEGLGKPVLYICERAKFDEKKTHFDTNHCTTVLWDSEAPKEFVDSLIATLKRSLST